MDYVPPQHAPRGLQYNNPHYRKLPLPPELATSRRWQLVYGEFRAPKYMAVMRDYIKNFDWTNTKESDVATAVKLMMVWMSMPKWRMVEWPTMNAMLREFSDRLLDAQHSIIVKYVHLGNAWIDDDVEWHALIEEPYEALQR